MPKEEEKCRVDDRQVNSQMEKLNGVNASLIDVTDRITDNLVSVLRLQHPVDPTKETVREELVPLANGIRDCRDSVAGVVERMRDLLDRLEVS